MTLSDYLVSLIRTATPAITGAALTWLATRLGPIGDWLANATSDDKLALYGAATTIAITAYYAVIRRLEHRWPALGRLLGKAIEPTYPKMPIT